MGVKVREKPKGSGVWWIFIEHQTKRKAKKIGKDKRLAREVAKKIEAKLILGELSLEKSDRPCPTFKEYAEHWLALPHDFKDVTRDEYEHKLKLHAFPVIGKLSLNQIDKRCLQSLFDGILIKGLSPSSLGIIRAAISEILKHAVSADLIDQNPIKSIVLKRKKKNSTIQPLTEEEAEQLLEKSKEYRDGEYYPIMLTALRTGLRIGETLALKWSDIDFKNRMIEVKRTLGKRGLSSTKNKKIRHVDMTPLLVDVLKKLKTDQKRWALKNRHPVPEFVFARKNGDHQIHQNFRHALAMCLERAKMRHIRVHDLRHSYATIRLLRGHNIGDVSYQMGHSSLSITCDIYGHWIPGRFKSEVDELDMVQPNATYTQPKINES
jgi:integrase